MISNMKLSSNQSWASSTKKLAGTTVKVLLPPLGKCMTTCWKVPVARASNLQTRAALKLERVRKSNQLTSLQNRKLVGLKQMLRDCQKVWSHKIMTQYNSMKTVKASRKSSIKAAYAQKLKMAQAILTSKKKFLSAPRPASQVSIYKRATLWPKWYPDYSFPVNNHKPLT